MKKHVLTLTLVSVLFGGGVEGFVQPSTPSQTPSATVSNPSHSVAAGSSKRSLKEQVDNVIDKKLETIYRLLEDLRRSKKKGKGSKKHKKIKKPLNVEGFLHIRNRATGERFKEFLATDKTGTKLYLSKKSDKNIRKIDIMGERVIYKDKKSVRHHFVSEKENGTAAIDRFEEQNRPDERLQLPPQQTTAPATVPQLPPTNDKSIEELVKEI